MNKFNITQIENHAKFMEIFEQKISNYLSRAQSLSTANLFYHASFNKEELEFYKLLNVNTVEYVAAIYLSNDGSTKLVILSGNLSTNNYDHSDWSRETDDFRDILELKLNITFNRCSYSSVPYIYKKQ